MNVHDKYRMIRTIKTDDAVREIEKAVDELKGRRELSVKDFLPK